MNKILSFFDLHQGEEKKETVLENVIANISFRGSNAWILACAIVVASVGLNVNSTAVIIGAMLISPLMGPIVGAGFALGTFDFPLLKKSIKNLLIATVISLVVSFIYFLLSPFKEAQSELLARTSPNIYDVMIAIFGGLVGVIAITRVDKGNPIPGVAIATALMPPLCTAGYGLAIGNFAYFAGALFLYIINCVFICISTFIIVKYLRYPKTHYVDQQRVKQFVQQELSNKGYTVIYEKMQLNSKPKKLELAFLAKKFSRQEIKSLEQTMQTFGIENTQLIIHQDSLDLKSSILSEIDKRTAAVSEKDLTIRALNNELTKYQVVSPELDRDIKVLFPELNSYSMGMQQHYAKTDSVANLIAFIYTSPTALTQIQQDKLQKWLKNHFPKDSVEIIKR